MTLVLYLVVAAASLFFGVASVAADAALGVLTGGAAAGVFVTLMRGSYTVLGAAGRRRYLSAARYSSAHFRIGS